MNTYTKQLLAFIIILLVAGLDTQGAYASTYDRSQDKYADERPVTVRRGFGSSIGSSLGSSIGSSAMDIGDSVRSISNTLRAPTDMVMDTRESASSSIRLLENEGAALGKTIRDIGNTFKRRD